MTGGGMITITLTLTEQQLRTMMGLLDAGLRAAGWSALGDANDLNDAIEKGVAGSTAVPMPGPKAVAD